MFSARVRTGENDRNYRLGNNYEINGKYNFITSQNTTLFAGAELSYADSIHGRDDEITVGGAFPYPAGITNPELYGGSKVRLFGGVNYLATDWLQLQLSASKPVYQNLNGPQPRELAFWFSIVDSILSKLCDKTTKLFRRQNNRSSSALLLTLFPRDCRTR